MYYYFDWTPGCPDICLNEILDTPADMFQMKLLSFPITVIAKRMAVPSVDRALSTRLKIGVNSKPYLPESQGGLSLPDSLLLRDCPFSALKSALKHWLFLGFDFPDVAPSSCQLTSPSSS